VTLIRAGAKNTYDAPVRVDTGESACYSDVVTGDLNRDGFIDALVSDLYSKMVYAFFGRADGSFVARGGIKPSTRQHRTGRRQRRAPYGMDLGDLDDDGLLDLVVAGYKAKKISSLWGIVETRLRKGPT
jgi:hypothetical protein